MADEISDIEVEEKNNPMASIVLPLRDKNENFTFHSQEDLKSFLEEETKHWEWLSSVPAPWTTFASHIKTQFVNIMFNNLSAIAKDWENNDEIALKDKIKKFEHILMSVDFPFSCRKTGKAISHESTKSNIIALNMLYLCITPKGETYTGEMAKIAKQFNVIFTNRYEWKIN